MPDSCLYTIWFENIPCWISLVYYSCYLDHMNAIYWRAFWLNHIFAIHTDCITGVVKSNVWRPPLGHKMQARMDSNAVLWTTGLCSQKKIREKVREQRLVREGLQDNITSFLKFLRGHQRSFLLIYAKTLADMEKHCTDVWLLYILNMKKSDYFGFLGSAPYCCHRFFYLLFVYIAIYLGLTPKVSSYGLWVWLNSPAGKVKRSKFHWMIQADNQNDRKTVFPEIHLEVIYYSTKGSHFGIVLT